MKKLVFIIIMLATTIVSAEWTQAEIDDFMSECAQPPANYRFCACSRKYLMQKYPNSEDIHRITVVDTQAAAYACRYYLQK